MGLVQPQLAAFVHQLLLHMDRHHVGQEHVVDPQGDDVKDPALDVHRAFPDEGAGDLPGGEGGEAQAGEFVHLPTGADAAEVGGPGQGGGGGRDLPEPQPTGANGDPPPAGGQNPPGGGVDTITFAPVFNFYGPTTPEQAKEAGQISFAEFTRMYDRMKAEERRKSLSASTR